jgi:NAD(P)-dependent dehydrogenase (short-subunit alcohol dehydrogenase family)
MELGAGTRAVITGAGGGLGRALALELAARGGSLVISDVDGGAAEETARLARDAGAREARAVRCDVTRLADVEALAAVCEGAIDLLVNNAGVSSAGLVGELPIDDWRWTLDVDLYGVIHGCHVFVPRLRRQGRGHVLNVASAAGLLCAPRMAAYNVAKAGVIALSETLAAELRGSGVGVTVLCPTFLRTNVATAGRFADERSRATAERLVAGGRPADEVARAALASVERGELHSVPMADGRWLWRLKRAAPGGFPALAAAASRWIDRIDFRSTAGRRHP